MQVTTMGIDLAKNVFQLHGVDAANKVDTFCHWAGLVQGLSDVDGRGMLLSVMRAKRSHDAIGVGGGEPISKTAFSA